MPPLNELLPRDAGLDSQVPEPVREVRIAFNAHVYDGHGHFAQDQTIDGGAGTIGNVYYLTATDDTWLPSDYDNLPTISGLIGVCVAENSILFDGDMTSTAHGLGANGIPIYVGADGVLTLTDPVTLGAGFFSRQVGHVADTDTIRINISNKYLTSVLTTIGDLIVSGNITADNLLLNAAGCIIFEGTTDDDFEVTLCGGDPTSDITITLPDQAGEVLLSLLSANIDGNGKTITKTPADINAQTGTTYNLVEADGNKLVTLDNASAITVTLPPSLDDGFTVSTMQKGVGTVSYTTAGTIISKSDNTDQNGKGTGAVLIHLGSNVWWVVGDLA